jgi:uncharacterized protein with GYD domain
MEVDMSAYIGFLNYNNAGKRSGDDELKVGRAARSIAEMQGGGGRFLSVWWTQDENDMVLIFEGRDEEQAMSVFKKIEEQEDVTIRVTRSLAEGEKERATQGKPV